MPVPIAAVASDRSTGPRRVARQCLRPLAVVGAGCVAFLLAHGACAQQGAPQKTPKASAVPQLRAGPAASYPERPIRLLLPTAVGGAVDTTARVIGPALAESFGQQVIVDNRPGAGGIIGFEIAAKAAPDGYTIMMCDVSFSVIQSLFKTLPFSPAKDFVPISPIASVPFVLVTNISTSYKSIDDLVAAARAKPGQLNFGSAGIGSPPHLGPELLAVMSGVKFTHVPFKGAPQALIEVLGGRLEFMVVSMPLAKPQIDAGKLRGLAVTARKRALALPNLPTVEETGLKGYDVTVWNGVFAPAGTHRDLIAKFSEHVARALNDADFKEKLAARGAEPLIMTPAQFAKHFQAEIVKWAQLVKSSGATAQ